MLAEIEVPTPELHASKTHDGFIRLTLLNTTDPNVVFLIANESDPRMYAPIDTSTESGQITETNGKVTWDSRVRATPDNYWVGWMDPCKHDVKGEETYERNSEPKLVSFAASVSDNIPARHVQHGRGTSSHFQKPAIQPKTVFVMPAMSKVVKTPIERPERRTLNLTRKLSSDSGHFSQPDYGSRSSGSRNSSLDSGLHSISPSPLTGQTAEKTFWTIRNNTSYNKTTVTTSPSSVRNYPLESANPPTSRTLDTVGHPYGRRASPFLTQIPYRVHENGQTTQHPNTPESSAKPVRNSRRTLRRNIPEQNYCEGQTEVIKTSPMTSAKPDRHRKKKLVRAVIKSSKFIPEHNHQKNVVKSSRTSTKHIPKDFDREISTESVEMPVAKQIASADDEKPIVKTDESTYKFQGQNRNANVPKRPQRSSKRPTYLEEYTLEHDQMSPTTTEPIVSTNESLPHTPPKPTIHLQEDTVTKNNAKNPRKLIHTSSFRGQKQNMNVVKKTPRPTSKPGNQEEEMEASQMPPTTTTEPILKADMSPPPTPDTSHPIQAEHDTVKTVRNSRSSRPTRNCRTLKRGERVTRRSQISNKNPMNVIAAPPPTTTEQTTAIRKKTSKTPKQFYIQEIIGRRTDPKKLKKWNIWLPGIIGLQVMSRTRSAIVLQTSRWLTNTRQTSLVANVF
eukprot:27337_1